MSGLVYHQRKLKENTLQIGNQKKKTDHEKKNIFSESVSVHGSIYKTKTWCGRGS